MTVSEKYDKRISICKQLRTVEEEIKSATDVRDKYDQVKGNERVELSVYVEGGVTEYVLDKSTAITCLDLVIGSFRALREGLIRDLENV